MVRQTIVSALMNKRRRIPETALRSLVVRGGGILVDDSLARRGWQGSDPVITTLLTCNIESGAVLGARYETRGALKDMVFKAEELWPGALKGATVTIRFEDLSCVDWNPEGDNRNQSQWLDGADMNVKIAKEDGTIIESQDQKDDAHVGDLCMRFTVYPFTIDKAILNAGISPLGKEPLKAKLEGMGKTLSSPLIPTVAVKLAVVKGKAQNGLAIVLAPTEGPGDKYGLGHLPLLEFIGAGQPVLPDHDKLEEEMVALLRSTAATNNVSLTRLQAVYTDASFPTSTTGAIPMEWPAYRGAVAEAAAATPAPTGRWL